MQKNRHQKSPATVPLSALSKDTASAGWMDNVVDLEEHFSVEQLVVAGDEVPPVVAVQQLPLLLPGLGHCTPDNSCSWWSSNQPAKLSSSNQQPVNQPTSQHIYLVNQSTSQSINQSFSQSTKLQVNLSTDSTINQPFSQLVQSTNHLFKQSFSQSTSQADSQSIALFVNLTCQLCIQNSQLTDLNSALQVLLSRYC